MASCAAIQDKLSAFLDGALPEGDAAEVRAHAADCAGCREELEGLRRDAALIEEALSEHPFDGALVKAIMERVPRSAPRAAAPAARDPGRRAKVIQLPRLAFIGAAAAAAALLIAATSLLGPAPEVGGPAAFRPVGRIETDSQASLLVTRQGSTSSLKQGAEIHDGDILRNQSFGAMAVRFEDGSRMTLRHGTAVRVHAPGRAYEFDIQGDEGQLFAEVTPLADLALRGAPAREAFRVRTAHLLVEVVGTKFDVWADREGTAATVLEGRVRCTPPGGAAVVVGADEQAVAAGPTVAVAKVRARDVLRWVQGEPRPASEEDGAARPVEPARPLPPGGATEPGRPASPDEGMDQPIVPHPPK